MSVRSRKSSRAIDRPFDAGILKRAREIVGRYRLILEEDPEVGFLGRSIELPGVMADGPTPEKCVKEVREALAGVVATMLEAGESPPIPASEERRTDQVNIRLTSEEKLLLEEAARRKGFRGVSDYVRTVTLQDLLRKSA